MQSGWTPFEPAWEKPEESARCFAAFAPQVVGVGDKDEASPAVDASEEVVSAYLADVAGSVSRQEALRHGAAAYVLVDLVRQGWSVQMEGRRVLVAPPGENGDPRKEKQRIRAQELLRRAEQLSTPSIRLFVNEMETPRLYQGRFVSIFSLMRDGVELAATLRRLRSDNRLSIGIGEVVQPYLQVLRNSDERCPFTGLRLNDIWRYFRFTWANQAMSVPGRTMRFIVRDAAAPSHPIVGIGALSSPIVQLSVRDRAIGWDSTSFLDRVTTTLDPSYLPWAHDGVRSRLSELYVADLIEDGVLTQRDIDAPSGTCIRNLETAAKEAQAAHFQHVPSRDLKRVERRENGQLEPNWVARARTPLFRAKRCRELAQLLKTRQVLQSLGSVPATDALREMLHRRDGRQALAHLIRLEKATKIGISMADITVCGALPPYNALVGGKLIGALAASPMIVHEYRRRYEDVPSEIASAMAGRPIRRNPALVLLGTTSMFGITSSQYNRLKIPAEWLGGLSGKSIYYTPVGSTLSYGTSQFSERTLDALVDLTRQVRKGGLRVNSIFGEGVSPKLRKVRDALDVLGLPSDVLLQHSRKRLVYMVPLASNYREYLWGIDDTPRYLFPMVNPSPASEGLVRWWLKRWAAPRAQSEAVLEEIERHTLIQPIEHGARVCLPNLAADQVPLFEV